MDFHPNTPQKEPKKKGNSALQNDAVAHSQDGADAYNQKDIVTSGFLQKKSERIATAIYVITDLFPVREPLREELRLVALECLLDSPSQGHEERFSKKESEEKKQAFHKLLSRWNLAYLSGFVGEGNFKILKDELFHVLGGLSQMVQKENADSRFDEDFFQVKDKEEMSSVVDTKPDMSVWERDEEAFDVLESRAQEGRDMSDRNVSQKDKSVSQKKGSARKSEAKRDDSPFVRASNTNRNSASSGNVPSAQRLRPAKTVSHTNGGNGERREAILSLIKEKGNVSVKDVSAVVTGLSEKTLQRELTALVENGVLEKKGERRWSRYSLR